MDYMKTNKFTCSIVVFVLFGCTPIRAPLPPEATVPPPTATALRLPTSSSPEEVSFTAADGTTLKGTLYGSGRIALVLSNMGDNDPTAWDTLVPLLVERGYLVLTYNFRYPTRTATFTSTMANQTVDDLHAAVTFVQERGAEKLVLIGASLGGMATAKVAATTQISAMIIMAAPADLLEFDFLVEAGELAAVTAPKLFIGSQDDTTVPMTATQHMFELAAEPKELHIYDSSAHGLQLLTTNHAVDLYQRLIDFIVANAPSAE